MRAVVQRVSQARVVVGGAVVGEIGLGLLVLVGIATDDKAADALWMAEKIATLRVFADDHRPMNRDVIESGGAVCVVSQFTLLGDARRGRRPGFTDAAAPEVAVSLIADVVQDLRGRGLQVAEGEFGAMMSVRLTNEGPVTILLDSRKAF